MKKIVFLTSLCLLMFSLIACSKKNPFYGVSKEDTTGPEIYIDNPATAATQIGTFNLIGHAQDAGGDNTVLKIEVSLDGGVTWNLANGTVNWSYTVDSLSAWGVIKLAKTIIIRATDTDYKKNTSTISVSYNIDNTNPSLIGSITDINDTLDYNAISAMDGFHQNSETKTINYRWKIEPGVLGYEVNLYNSTDNKADIFVKNNPSSNGTYAYSASEINNNTALTTGISSINAIRSTCGADSCMSFSFSGVDGKKYYAAIKPYDSSLNRGPAKISVEETIDTVAPAQITNFRANSLLDTAPTKNFNSAQVTFSWNPSTDANTAIRYYKIDVKGDASIVLTVPGDVLNYTYDYTPLLTAGAGSFNARIEAVDMAGNWSAAWGATADNHVNFNINTNGVSETLNPLKVGTNYQNTATISFTWTASAAADHKGYDIQIVRNDGKSLVLLDKDDATYFTAVSVTVFAGPDAATGISNVTAVKALGTITLSFAGTNSYSYQIQVKSYNTAATRLPNWEISDYILIDTNNAASLVPTNLTVKGAASGNVYHNSITAKASIAWNLPAAVSYSGIAYYQVDVNNDNMPDALDVNCGSTQTNFTAASATACFAAGTYSNIKVRAVNKTGTIGDWLAPGINLFVDNQSPNAIAGLTVGGSGTTHYMTAAGTPAIAWTGGADVGSSGLKTTPYEILVTDITAGSSASYFAASSPASSITFSANKQYSVQVRSWDKSENSGAWSNAVTVIVDATLPSIPANLKVSNSAGPLYFNSAQTGLIITWDTVADTFGIQNYQISLDGGSTIFTSTASNYLITNFALSGTAYSVKVQAIDKAGNPSGWSTVPITLYVENTPPTDITYTNSGSYSAPNATFSWNTSTDGLSGLKQYHIQYRINAGSWSSSIQQAGTSYNHDMTPLASADTVEIRVCSEDHAGNFSNWVISASVMKL